jgi:hypothetical protein
VKRTTHLPDDPPPLVERASASRYGSVAGGFPGVAAKLSLCAGLFSFLLNHHAASPQVRLSPDAVRGVVLTCVILIVAGLGLALWALISNRRTRRPGVTGFAVAGLLVNGLLIAANAYYFIRVAMHKA